MRDRFNGDGGARTIETGKKKTTSLSRYASASCARNHELCVPMADFKAMCLLFFSRIGMFEDLYEKNLRDVEDLGQSGEAKIPKVIHQV